MRLRVKVQSIRTSLWVGIGLVLLCVVYLLVTMYRGQKGPNRKWAWTDKSVIEDAMKVEGTPSVDPEARGAFDSFSSLWKLNVTGKQKAAAVDRNSVEVPKPTLQPLNELFEIRAIAAPLFVVVVPKGQTPTAGAGAGSTDSSKRWPTQVSRSWLQVGDSLEPPYDAEPYLGTVLQITPDEVLFSWGGDEVGLGLAKLPDPKDPTQTLPGSPAGDQEAEAPVVTGDIEVVDRTQSEPLEDGGWYIGTVEQQRIRDQHDDLLAEVSIGSHFDRSARQQRIKINSVNEGSLAEERGFEAGDIVLSINGRAVTSKYSAINYFKEFPNLSTYRVEIERKGKTITKSFKIR